MYWKCNQLIGSNYQTVFAMHRLCQTSATLSTMTIYIQAYMLYWNSLTPIGIGRMEGYCNQVFCLSINKISGQLTTLLLRLSNQQTWRIKIKDRLFLELSGYKVMPVFTTYNCDFTAFRRLLVAHEVNGNTTRRVWRLSLSNHSLKSCKIEAVAATTSSWL